MDLLALKLEHFQDLIGQNFAIKNSEVVLSLLEAKAQNTRPDAPRVAFSLLFACPVPAPQGTYAIQHETLGQLEIFLVPIKQDDAGVQLEAIFS
jgi:hypothetical protein